MRRLIAIWLCALAMHAQSPSAGMEGRLTDPVQRALPGVAITITETGRGLARHTVTDEQDVRNRKAEEALSSFDHRHRLAVSFLWDLPGGIALMGFGSMQSGAPFTVNIPSDNANIGPGPAQRPDVLRDANLDERTAERWFDTAAFAMPRQYTFGNAGRNIVFGDGLVNVDLSAMKKVRVSEQVTVQVRGEFFNAFNQTNFADAPGRMAFTPSFGRYFAAENPRQVQIGLKVLF